VYDSQRMLQPGAQRFERHSVPAYASATSPGAPHPPPVGTQACSAGVAQNPHVFATI
jgi:hypothetical protein